MLLWYWKGVNKREREEGGRDQTSTRKGQLCHLNKSYTYRTLEIKRRFLRVIPSLFMFLSFYAFVYRQNEKWKWLPNQNKRANVQEGQIENDIVCLSLFLCATVRVNKRNVKKMMCARALTHAIIHILSLNSMLSFTCTVSLLHLCSPWFLSSPGLFWLGFT